MKRIILSIEFLRADTAEQHFSMLRPLCRDYREHFTNCTYTLPQFNRISRTLGSVEKSLFISDYSGFGENREDIFPSFDYLPYTGVEPTPITELLQMVEDNIERYELIWCHLANYMHPRGGNTAEGYEIRAKAICNAVEKWVLAHLDQAEIIITADHGVVLNSILDGTSAVMPRPAGFTRQLCRNSLRVPLLMTSSAPETITQKTNHDGLCLYLQGSALPFWKTTMPVFKGLSANEELRFDGINIPL